MSEKNLQLSFFITLFVAVLALLFFTFLPYLGIVVIAATFAVVFYPLHRKVIRWMRGNEGLAAFFSTVLVMLIVLVPLAFFGFEVFQEAKSLYTHLASGADSNLPANITSMLKERLAEIAPFLSLDITKYFGQIFGSIAKNFSVIFSTLTEVTVSIALSLFALYYFFKDGYRLQRKLLTVSPLSDRDNRIVLKKLQLTVNAVIRGSIIVAIVQGLLGGIGFWIFGISNSALWGSVIIIASLIPAFGSALITVPAALYLLFSGDTIQGMGLLAWSTLLVGTIDNFLRPKLIQRNIDIHPFLILLSAIGGISIFGPIGFLLGPLILSLFFALLEIYPQIIIEKTEQESGGEIS